MDSFFISIYNFGSFRDPFPTITNPFEFNFRLRFIYKQRKWFLWTLIQAADKHGDEWGFTWYLWFGIYTLKPWNNNQSFEIDWRGFSFLRQIFFTIRHNNWKLIIAKTKEMFEISCSSFFWLSLALFYFIIYWIQ